MQWAPHRDGIFVTSPSGTERVSQPKVFEQMILRNMHHHARHDHIQTCTHDECELDKRVCKL